MTFTRCDQWHFLAFETLKRSAHFNICSFVARQPYLLNQPRGSCLLNATPGRSVLSHRICLVTADAMYASPSSSSSSSVLENWYLSSACTSPPLKLLLSI